MSQQKTLNCSLPPDLVGTAEALQHGQRAYEEVAMHCCTL